MSEKLEGKRLLLLIVTYRRDLELTKRLARSIQKHNVDNIPVSFLVPDDDVQLFSDEFSSMGSSVINETSIPVARFDQIEKGKNAGYFNQQLFKLGYGLVTEFESYLCLDSDAEFVRDFFYTDFFDAETELPYTFMSEDNELQAERSYDQAWLNREMKLRKIIEATGIRKDKPFIAVHGFQIFQTEVIFDMKNNLLTKLGLNEFRDLLEISEYEFNWYTSWVRARGKKFVPREPIFKTFHSSRELVRSLYFGIANANYAHGYIGVCVNGNFQHGRGAHNPLSLESDPAIVAGVYLTTRENLVILRNAFLAAVISLGLFVPKFIRRILIWR